MSNRGNRGQQGDLRGGGRGRGGRGAPGGPRGRGSPAPSESQASNLSFGSRGRGGGGGGDRGRGFTPGDRGGGPPRGGGGGGRGGGDRGRGFTPGDRGGGPPRGGGGGGGFRGGRGGGPGGFGGGDGPIIFKEGVPAQVPAHLSDANLNSIVSKLKSTNISGKLAVRPGYGTVGRAITLRANFFSMKYPKGPIFDYTVEISPTTDINRLKGRIFELLEQSPIFKPHLSYIAHDRSQRIVSAKKLPQPLDITILFYDDHEKGPGPNAKSYSVSIKFDRELDKERLTRYLDANPQSRGDDMLPLISALNLVVQQYASSTGVRVGRNRYFFPSSAEKVSLGPKIEAIQGFYASVRPAVNSLMVNVNVCMTAFVEPGNLADALLAFSRNSRGSMPTLPKSLIKSIKVQTRHLGYKKPLKLVGTTSARNTYFDCEEFGGKISVEQYFLKKYKMKLKYPADLPVVDIGSQKKINWVPAELCDITPGNAYRAKLSDQETAQMIRYACNKPRVNADAITGKGFPSLGLSSPMKGPLDGFGLTIDTEMAVIPGRELAAPRLSYKSGQPPRVQNGSWNIMDVKFHRGASISSWAVLVIRDGRNTFSGPGDPNLKGLVDRFNAKLARSGMVTPSGVPRLLPPISLPNPRDDPGRVNAIEMVRRGLKEAIQKVKPSFILVLLENRDNYIYPGIKRIGDVELGIQTIHMQVSKALGDERKQDQYLSNVALKVNTKLGGMNHLLDANATKWLTKKKTMMVGIDVTHPGPGSREGTPSIAAVVASVDDSFVQFPASLRIQQSKKEMLDELKDMLVERLLVYEKKNRVLPERVFVYRDGVSEGQFETVIDEELPQILQAFKKVGTQERKKEYRPLLSIIICGKRHHARFYPTDSALADRNGNTRPGTCVDKGITGVFDYDFYLQAHAGLQGTVKATHYTVVHDENKLSADEIQQGTHDASYLYARATKAVSLIPAAYYADLACERGRCYLNDFLVDDKTTSGGGRVDKEEEKNRVFAAAKASWGEGLHVDTRERMFYI